jgi:hypothetical protein
VGRNLQDHISAGILWRRSEPGPLYAKMRLDRIAIDLAKTYAGGASASRTTVVMPHYAYARSDKKDAPRISIGARLVADLLVTAGANRILTMTLHSPQVHGFFSVPVDPFACVARVAQNAAHGPAVDIAIDAILSGIGQQCFARLDHYPRPLVHFFRPGLPARYAPPRKADAAARGVALSATRANAVREKSGHAAARAGRGP